MSVAPGLIVAAPASGSGKTTLTLGLLRALRRRGVAVASFKVGPDYIDPAFHAAASGRPCRNLDPWAMALTGLQAGYGAAGAGAELVIGEGVMGLFDGALDGSGSTADLAASLGLPVVLVIDVRGQGASAAAVIEGFVGHRPDVTVAGVIFNRVGGPGHRRLLEAACRDTGMAPLGFVPRSAALDLPSRHLGLVQAAEHADLGRFLDGAADVVGGAVDLDALMAPARPPSRAATGGSATIGVPPLGQRIAIARDAAFAFCYEHVLDAWREAGAEAAFFSPLGDEAPAAGCDAVYLPGGYPELHAGRLAGNRRFLAGLSAAAGRGASIYGECGGYMVLGRALVDGAGAAHAMVGLLPVEVSFAERRLHLGYRQAVAVAAGPLGAAGAAFRGHEFHYATTIGQPGGAPLFACRDALGADLGAYGCRVGAVMGSFLHLIDQA